jgi:hypothetical protein|eukprot:COSAG01_NODE_2095_length_8411_cov_3.964611_1_plen_96_part_00
MKFPRFLPLECMWAVCNYLQCLSMPPRYTWEPAETIKGSVSTSWSAISLRAHIAATLDQSQSNIMAQTEKNMSSKKLRGAATYFRYRHNTVRDPI